MNGEIRPSRLPPPSTSKGFALRSPRFRHSNEASLGRMLVIRFQLKLEDKYPFEEAVASLAAVSAGLRFLEASAEMRQRNK